MTTSHGNFETVYKEILDLIMRQKEIGPSTLRSCEYDKTHTVVRTPLNALRFFSFGTEADRDLCSLDISWNVTETYNDDEGNVFEKCTASIKMNWGSHGMSTIPLVADRLAAYVNVFNLARKIQDIVTAAGEINSFVMSNETRMARAASQLRREIDWCLEDALPSTVKAMRVTSPARFMDHAQLMFPLRNRTKKLFDRIPDGSYKVKVNDRWYDVSVGGWGARITRTA